MQEKKQTINDLDSSAIENFQSPLRGTIVQTSDAD